MSEHIPKTALGTKADWIVKDQYIPDLSVESKDHILMLLIKANAKIQQLELTNSKLILHVEDIEKANDNCQSKIATLEKQNEIYRKALLAEFPGEYGLAVMEHNRQALKDAEEV